jgi:uncharacterized iron-regulated protein
MRKLILFVGKTAAVSAAVALLLTGGAASVRAGSAPAVVASAEAASHLLRDADVVILGEVHDNAAHHLNQAEILLQVAPRAVVWEVITQEQADGLTPDMMGSADVTAKALDWAESGWPAFDLYAPVFEAAAPARQYGALVPRAEARSALEQGVASYFGARAAEFGLDKPLPEAEQSAREAGQMANHCNAMPEEMLPVLVDFQRLRDAALAAATDRALSDTGGPVVVITGNGHARLDRGLAVYLSAARPGAKVLSLGQSEEGAISGTFDVLLDSPAAERPDPCLVFKKG